MVFSVLLQFHKIKKTLMPVNSMESYQSVKFLHRYCLAVWIARAVSSEAIYSEKTAPQQATKLQKPSRGATAILKS